METKKPKKSFRENFIPSKNDPKNVLINKLIILGSVAALLVCALILGEYFFRIYEAKHNSETIGDIYNTANARVISNKTDEEEPIPGETVTMPVTTVPEPDMPWVEPERLPSAIELLEINPDYAGYVSIPGVFSEAVVLDADNEFYLTHNFYGQRRAAGTVFADYRNVINGENVSDNIVLYGHNNRDGTMFGNMDYYKYNANYWLKNPFVYFDNFYTQDVYVILASFITNVDPKHDNGYVFDYQNFLNFDDTTYTFESFKENIDKKNQIITGLDYDENDKYLTLSTCSYEWEPSRHVMIARKLRPGETTANIDTTAFKLNPDAVWPAVYYKYTG
ncbi:MAG: class B sortase [Ruminococcus sp.]|jgi:SrtB family sortase|nr:class B sortase [Ruminococcus sp.]